MMDSQIPVTLGFKIPPELKLELALEAEMAGLTLSSYVLGLVQDNQLFLNEKTNEIKKLKSQNTLLLEQLSFFENNATMQILFTKFKGEKIQFKDKSTGKDLSITVDSILDLYNIIINSFEYAT